MLKIKSVFNRQKLVDGAFRALRIQWQCPFLMVLIFFVVPQGFKFSLERLNAHFIFIKLNLYSHLNQFQDNRGVQRHVSECIGMYFHCVGILLHYLHLLLIFRNVFWERNKVFMVILVYICLKTSYFRHALAFEYLFCIISISGNFSRLQDTGQLSFLKPTIG